MANEQALMDELSKPEYANLTDQQAADAVNAKTVTERQSVDSGTLQDACMALGIWGRLEAAAETGKPDPPASIARTMMQRMNSGRPLDLDNAAVIAMVQDAIQHGLITQEQQQQLDTMANKEVRWVDAEGIGECGIGYIINARRAIAGGA